MLNWAAFKLVQTGLDINITTIYTSFKFLDTVLPLHVGLLGNEKGVDDDDDEKDVNLQLKLSNILHIHY